MYEKKLLIIYNIIVKIKENVNVAEYNKFEGKFVKNAYDPTLTDKDET